MSRKHTRTKPIEGSYAIGVQPPSGYVAWHDWAAAQARHGLKQTQCPKCRLWKFPQEVHCVLSAHAADRDKA